MTYDPAHRPGDQIKVSVMVRTDIERAFKVFTQEINLWWRRGRRFRIFNNDRGFIHLEPKPDGRVFESITQDSGEEKVIEIGRISAWEPPHHFSFHWRAVNFGPEDKDTVVEVKFRTLGSKTEVTVRHYGWSAIRQDHPVRHKLAVRPFLAMMGNWWGDLLTSYRHRVMSP